ncbi:MAG TPA: hypothetical protein VN462_06690 [Negativicutes bacterium]|nr:hypothetical protein [Negativicutes bacterium]
MKWQDAVRELPVLGALSLCASFILSQGLLGLMKGVEPLWTLLLCIALTVCWSLFMFHPRLRMVLAVAAACALLAGAWVLLPGSGSPVPGPAGGLLRDLGSYLTGGASVKQEHFILLFLVACIVVTFSVSVFTVWNLNFPMMMIAGLSLFIWRYALAKPLSLALSAGFLVTCLLYWLLWADKLRAHEERTAWRPQAAVLLFGLPICLLCVILAWFLPSPSAPLRDKQAEQAAFEFVMSKLAQTETEDNSASGNVGVDAENPQESSDGGGGGGGGQEEEPPVIPSPFPWLRLAFIAALILLLLAAVAAFRLWRRRHWIKRLQTLPPETSVPLLFGWLLSMLRCFGFIPGCGETLSEFVDRARTSEYLPATQVEASICAYLPIRYGGRRPGADERDAMLFAGLAVLETVKSRVGHVRYLFFAVLGRI